MQAPSNSAIENLRAQIARLKAAPREHLSTLRTGIASVDALLPSRGWPLGTTVELRGNTACGKTRLALKAIGQAQASQRLCAYVDGPSEFYPPAATALGVRLGDLLIARPSAPGQLVWTAIQLLRSGAFGCVVLDVTHTGVRLRPAENKKLSEAASAGESLLILLTTPQCAAEASLTLELKADGARSFNIRVTKSRWGGTGKSTSIAADDLSILPLPPSRYLTPEAAQSKAFISTGAAAHPISGNPRMIFGICGQRPGRDAPFPSIAQSLGV